MFTSLDFKVHPVAGAGHAPQDRAGRDSRADLPAAAAPDRVLGVDLTMLAESVAGKPVPG